MDLATNIQAHINLKPWTACAASQMLFTTTPIVVFDKLYLTDVSVKKGWDTRICVAFEYWHS